MTELVELNAHKEQLDKNLDDYRERVKHEEAELAELLQQRKLMEARLKARHETIQQILTFRNQVNN